MVTSPEYLEYQERKTSAYFEIIIGVCVIFFGVPIGIFSFSEGGIFISVFAFFIGIVIIFDGEKKLEKLQHIMWTKEALREHDESSSGFISTFINESKKNTPIKINIISDDDKLNNEINKIKILLEKLDENFISGKINEKNYEELKIKLIQKINLLKEDYKNMLIIKGIEKEKIELYKKIIIKELKKYDDSKFTKKEDNWEKTLLSLKNYENISLSLKELYKKANEFLENRRYCMIYYDFSEGKLWVKEFKSYTIYYSKVD